MARLAILAHLVSPLIALGMVAGWWSSLDHHAACRFDCQECGWLEWAMSTTSVIGIGLLVYVVLFLHAIRRALPGCPLPETNAPPPPYLGRWHVVTGSVLALVLLVICGEMTRHVPRSPCSGSWRPAGQRLEPVMGLRVDGQWELITVWDEDMERRVNDLGARADREARLGLRMRRWSWGPLTELMLLEQQDVLIEGIGFAMSLEDAAVLRGAYLAHLETAAYGGFRERGAALQRGPILNRRLVGSGVVHTVLVVTFTWLACTTLAGGVRRSLFLSDLVAARRRQARLARAAAYSTSTRFCARCGYDLLGLPAPVCPECGLAFGPGTQPTAAVH
ncbi:MAG: hypothetical protein KDA21_10100 [Phycisphaerales bacterium]|nr:hypothetical protein [Phycisphaerales bacterium]